MVPGPKCKNSPEIVLSVWLWNVKILKQFSLLLKHLYLPLHLLRKMIYLQYLWCWFMIWWKEQLMSYLRHCCAIFENSASAIEPTFAQPMHCILCYLWNHFSTKIKENKIFSFFVFAPSVWCLANSRHVQLQEWSIWLNTKRWHVKEVKMSDGLWRFACGDVSHICDNWFFYIFNCSPCGQPGNPSDIGWKQTRLTFDWDGSECVSISSSNVPQSVLGA